MCVHTRSSISRGGCNVSIHAATNLSLPCSTLPESRPWLAAIDAWLGAGQACPPTDALGWLACRRLPPSGLDATCCNHCELVADYATDHHHHHHHRHHRRCPENSTVTRASSVTCRSRRHHSATRSS
jgi:hypothetical protein